MGYIYGLDPGAASGALAWIDHEGRAIGIDYAAGQDESLPARLAEHFKSADLLVVERILAYAGGRTPPQDLIDLAYSSAIAIGVAGAMGIPVIHVQTSVWKKALGVTKDKNTSIAKACLLFGERQYLASKSKNKKGLVVADHNHAEALLLAYYGYMTGRKTNYELAG